MKEGAAPATVPLWARGILGLLLRYRYALLAILSAANGILDGFARITKTSDFSAFKEAGTALLTGHWNKVFSDPFIQVGPLTLGASGIFTALHKITRLRAGFLFAIVVYVLVTFGAIWLVRILDRDRGRTTSPLTELVVGLATITAGFGFITVVSGHPSEMLIPAFWILAVRDAQQDRGVRAGLWIAIAGAFKLWGILGVPVALLASSWRSRVWTVVIAGAALAVSYGPFFLTGDVGTFRYGWIVSRWAPLALFMDVGTPFSWTMRIVQGAAVVVLGTIPVLLFRHRPSASWAIPLGMVLARLATDPLLYNYYWLAPELLALVGIAWLWDRSPLWHRVVMVAGFYALAFVAFIDPTVATLVRFGLLLALLVAAWRSSEAGKEETRSEALAPDPSGLVISGS